MSAGAKLSPEFFARGADEVARDLLGCRLERRLAGRSVAVRIVETEAYLGARDRASHAWGGRRTARTAALFRPGGVAYVYRIYGLHFMLNVVTGSSDDGSAVLLRAGEPLTGAEGMARRRGLVRPPRPGDIAGGPGKLCQALAVDLELNGAPLDRGPLALRRGERVASSAVAVGPRIGVDYAGDAAAWPLRFALSGNPHVSRPRL